MHVIRKTIGAGVLDSVSESIEQHNHSPTVPLVDCQFGPLRSNCYRMRCSLTQEFVTRILDGDNQVEDDSVAIVVDNRHFMAFRCASFSQAWFGQGLFQYYIALMMFSAQFTKPCPLQQMKPDGIEASVWHVDQCSMFIWSTVISWKGHCQR